MIEDVSTPAVILGCETHGALGIARSLGRLGVRVHCIGSNRRAPTLLSRFCQQSYEWDVDNAGPEDTVDFLQRVGTQIGRKSILIPTSDIGAILVAEHASELRERFIFSERNPALVRSLCSKREMYHLARRFQVPTPETAFPVSPADLEEYLERAQFPLLIKAVFSRARSAKSIVLVHSERELREHFGAFAATGNIMLQEYIPGPDHMTWTFNGYFDAKSRCDVAFTGRKLRNYQPRFGMASLGQCVHNEIVRDTTIRFMQAIGYSGCLDLGYRFDARDGLYKVNDINPRVGAMFRCFVGSNGMDVVRALYQDLTGQPVTPSFTQEGRKWLVEDNDLASSLHDWSAGLITLKAWWASLKGVQETAYFAADDLVPLLSLLFSHSKRLARRALRVGAMAGGSRRGLST